MYRNASCASRGARWQVRVESFVSRDILDKTMGSNVPVLRHLAEEAAQQKSRHIVLVYGGSASARCFRVLRHNMGGKPGESCVFQLR